MTGVRGEAGTSGERLRRLASASASAEGDAAYVAATLALRARRLAAPRDDDRFLRPAGQAVLCFGIAVETYALPLADMAEVLPLAAWTPVPGVSQHLLGVVNVRGEIRPVMNLHAMLSLPEPSLAEPAAGAPPGYVVFLRDASREVGLRVDSLDRIRFVDPDGLTRPHQAGNGLPQRFVAGITPDTVVLLDTRQILGLDVLQDRRAAAHAAP